MGAVEVAWSLQFLHRCQSRSQDLNRSVVLPDQIHTKLVPGRTRLSANLHRATSLRRSILQKAFTSGSYQQ